MKIKRVAPNTEIREHLHNPLQKLWELSERNLEAIDTLKDKAIKAAKAKNVLASKTNVALQMNGNYKSQEMREAHNESAIGPARDAYNVAEAEKSSALEEVKTLRQVLSSIQTYVSAEKSLSEMYGYGQDKS